MKKFRESRYQPTGLGDVLLKDVTTFFDWHRNPDYDVQITCTSPNGLYAKVFQDNLDLVVNVFDDGLYTIVIHDKIIYKGIGSHALCEDLDDLKNYFEEEEMSQEIESNLKEDFEFYKDDSGKITVDKVITASKSGKTFRDGSKVGDTNEDSVKRIPLTKMSQGDSDLAKSVYKTLKKNNSLDNVVNKFKTSPKADVVMKADGEHIDIYYDNNKSGVADEKGVKLVASRKNLRKQLRENLEFGINLDNLFEVASVAQGTLPEDNLIYKLIDDIFNEFMCDEIVSDSKVVRLEKIIKSKLDDFEFGDFYNYLYDMLFTEKKFVQF